MNFSNKLKNFMLLPLFFQLGATSFARPIATAKTTQDLVRITTDQFNSYGTWENLVKNLKLSNEDRKFLEATLKAEKIKGSLPSIGRSGAYSSIEGHKFYIYPQSYGFILKLDNRFSIYQNKAGLKKNLESIKQSFGYEEVIAGQHEFLNLLDKIFSPPKANAVVPVIAYLLGAAVFGTVYEMGHAYLTYRQLEDATTSRAWQKADRISKISCSEDGSLQNFETMFRTPDAEEIAKEVEKCRKNVDYDPKYKDYSSQQKTIIYQACPSEGFIKAMGSAESGVKSRLTFSKNPSVVKTEFSINGVWGSPKENSEPVDYNIGYSKETLSLIMKNPVRIDKNTEDIMNISGPKSYGILYGLLEIYCKGDKDAQNYFNQRIKENEQVKDINLNEKRLHELNSRTLGTK